MAPETLECKLKFPGGETPRNVSKLNAQFGVILIPEDLLINPANSRSSF